MHGKILINLITNQKLSGTKSLIYAVVPNLILKILKIMNKTKKNSVFRSGYFRCIYNACIIL